MYRAIRIPISAQEDVIKSILSWVFRYFSRLYISFQPPVSGSRLGIEQNTVSMSYETFMNEPIFTPPIFLLELSPYIIFIIEVVFAHNFETVEHMFTNFGTYINHHQTVCKEQEPYLHLYFSWNDDLL